VRAWAAPGWEREAERVVLAAAGSVPRIAAALDLRPQDVLPLWIVVAPGGGRFEVEAPSWSAALARPSRHLVVVSGPALHAARMNVQETMAHEVAHVALGERLGEIGWMPRWMHEGLAVHYSNYRRLRDRFVFWGRGPVHLRDLEHSFPQNPTRARAAYLESHAAVLHMLEIAPITTLLDRLRAGEEFDAAFVAVYGITPVAFADHVDGEVARRWRYLAVVASGSSIFGMLTLLFVVAVSVKRIRDRRRRRQWEAEEAELELVPEAVTRSESPDA